MRLFALLVLLTGFAPATVVAQEAPRNDRQLRRAIDRIIAGDELGNALVGISIVDVRDGRVLFDREADRSLIPASNTKLYTTAVVLDQMGPDFTYRTDLFAVEDSVSEGTLYGTLVVRGSGDPVIGGRFNDGDITEVFRAWADSLRESGIRTIAGDIVGDDNFFDDVQLGYGWSWDDEPWWYSAEIGALSLNDNCVDFSTEPSHPGGPGVISWAPIQTGYVSVRNATVTVDSTESLVEGYTRVRDGNDMIVSSRVPVGYVERESIAVHNPTLYFVTVLREVLMAEGIAVTGKPVDIDDLSFPPPYAHARRVATHESVPLKEIVTVINKRSQNLYAEQVLKTLGALRPARDSDAAPGSASMGWEVGRQTLGRAGVDTSRVQLVDGSGLSRMNLVAPSMTTALLRHMWSHPVAADAFLESLPIAGVDGSLEYRMREGPATGNAKAKTGYVSNASTLSGYVTTAGGTPLAFSIMFNHYTIPNGAVRDMQDAIVQTLAAFRQ